MFTLNETNTHIKTLQKKFQYSKEKDQGHVLQRVIKYKVKLHLWNLDQINNRTSVIKYMRGPVDHKTLTV